MYPEFLARPEFFEPRVRDACLARVGADGFVPRTPRGPDGDAVEAA